MIPVGNELRMRASEVMGHKKLTTAHATGKQAIGDARLVT